MNPKKEILAILEREMGAAWDNLHRARLVFASYTDEVMDRKYGQSQETPREIIDGYEAEWRNMASVIQWFSNLTKERE